MKKQTNQPTKKRGASEGRIHPQRGEHPQAQEDGQEEEGDGQPEQTAGGGDRCASGFGGAGSQTWGCMATGEGPGRARLPSSSSWKLRRLARATSLFSRGLLRGFSPLPGSAPPGKPPPASIPGPGVAAEGGGAGCGCGPGPRSDDSPAGTLSPPPGPPGSSPAPGSGTSNGGGCSCSSSRSRSSSSESFRLRTFTRRAFRNIAAAATTQHAAHGPATRAQSGSPDRHGACALPPSGSPSPPTPPGRAPVRLRARSLSRFGEREDPRPFSREVGFCTGLYRFGGLMTGC